MFGPTPEDGMPPRVCIRYRCGLCQFSLLTGDEIVAGSCVREKTCPSPPTPPLRELTSLAQVLDTDGKQSVSSRFCYPDDRLDCYLDVTLHVEFQLCGSRYCRHHQSSVGIHAKCLAVLPFPLTPEFRQAARFSFEPSASDEQRRHDALQDILAHRLRNVLYPNLPEELCHMIAGYLVCEAATSAAVHLWLQHRSLDCVVKTSQDIWARYANVCGVRYLAMLSNESHDPLDIQIFDARQQFNTAYLLEDHVGIRQVIFAMDGELGIPSSGDSWWRTVSTPKVLSMISDVSSPFVL